MTTNVNEKLVSMGGLIKAHQKSSTKINALATKVEELNATAMTEEQVTAAINAQISSVYTPGGSVAFADLPELIEANVGLVVSVNDQFTTTSSFMEGAGKTHPAGTNVVVIKDGETYKYDVMSSFVDLSGLVEKENGKGLSSNDYTNEEKAKLAGIAIATDAEVEAAMAEIYGED